VYSPSPDPDTEQRMRARHARAAQALDVRVEPGREFWGWAGRTLGAPAHPAAGQPAWLRLVSSPEDKVGDLDGRRPALLAVHDAVDDTTAYRAELSARVDQPVLSDDPVRAQYNPTGPQFPAREPRPNSAQGSHVTSLHAARTSAASTMDIDSGGRYCSGPTMSGAKGSRSSVRTNALSRPPGRPHPVRVSDSHEY
jgi:hypothetical protein